MLRSGGGQCQLYPDCEPVELGQGAYILGCEGPVLTASERAFFSEAQPFGFILFARNVSDPEQLSRLCADLRESVGRVAPILIDQEGGRVQRMTPPYWRQWLPPLDFVSHFGSDQAMWLRGRLIGEELIQCGVDVNCGPTLDIARESTHPFLQNRCYGFDPETVLSAGKNFADGLAAAGVRAIPKHMPGHGRASVDSHHDLPRTDAPLADLETSDFLPFRAFACAGMGMSAHVVYSAIDPDRPATTSTLCIDYIRGEIGFDGLLMTDDISMNALGGSVRDRSRAALKAGCDMVLHCNGNLAEMEGVAAVAGMLSGVPEARAERALEFPQARQNMDAAEAEEELTRLMETVDA